MTALAPIPATRADRKTALVTGATGQVASYLIELLLDKGYHVHGLIRRSSNFNTQRIDHIFNHEHLELRFGDLTDSSALHRLLVETEPDEIYNLGAQSHVGVSFEMPVHTADVVALGALRLFEEASIVCPNAHIYQAGSSEMFGSSPAPQSEQTPFHPRSPYGVAKLAAHWFARNYRARGLFVACGILNNIESERRGNTFVTRKITRAVARIKHGMQSVLRLGNLDARRDWMHAEDAVRAIWMMTQHRNPEDFVIGSGVSRTVYDFARVAFELVDLKADSYIVPDDRYLRPTEVDHLRADPRKAREVLGWEPRVSFDKLVRRMVRHDLALTQREH